MPIGVKLVKEYDMVKKVFVEGLEFVDENHLLISSGPNGGFLDFVEIFGQGKGYEKLRVTNFVQINSKYFSEGATVVGDSVYWLTY